MKRIKAALIAVIALCAMIVVPAEANAGTYVIGMYGAINYGEPMQSFAIPRNCSTNGTAFRWAMPTSPINVRDRASSLAIFATAADTIKYCNNVGITSKTTGRTIWKCVAKNNRGWPRFDPLSEFNDRVLAVLLRYSRNCPTYDLSPNPALAR